MGYLDNYIKRMLYLRSAHGLTDKNQQHKQQINGQPNVEKAGFRFYIPVIKLHVVTFSIWPPNLCHWRSKK
jgi:hypothetical protein